MKSSLASIWFGTTSSKPFDMNFEFSELQRGRKFSNRLWFEAFKINLWLIRDPWIYNKHPFSHPSIMVLQRPPFQSISPTFISNDPNPNALPHHPLWRQTNFPTYFSILLFPKHKNIVSINVGDGKLKIEIIWFTFRLPKTSLWDGENFSFLSSHSVANFPKDFNRWNFHLLRHIKCRSFLWLKRRSVERKLCNDNFVINFQFSEALSWRVYLEISSFVLNNFLLAFSTRVKLTIEICSNTFTLKEMDGVRKFNIKHF